MNNSDMPAMPIPEEQFDRACDGVFIATGLTKREKFAAMAMQGLTSSANIDVRANSELLAETSVYIADALLAALSTTAVKGKDDE